MIAFEIDFEDATQDGHKRPVEATILELESTIPAVFRGSKVARKSDSAPNQMGAEVLPIIEVLVGAPALLLLIREVGKIIQARLAKNSSITIRKKKKNGELKELQITSDRFSTAEAQTLVDKFLSEEG